MNDREMRLNCIEMAIRCYSSEGEWTLVTDDVIQKAETFFRYCVDGPKNDVTPLRVAK